MITFWTLVSLLWHCIWSMASWEENRSPKSCQRTWRSSARRRCPLRSPLHLKERLTTWSFKNVTSLERVLLMVRSKTWFVFFKLNKVWDTEHFKYQNCRYYWLSLIILIPALQGYFLTNLWQVEHLHSHTVLKNKSFILPRISRLFVSKVYKKPTINVKMTVIQCL